MTTNPIQASSRKDAHIDLALDPETNSEGTNSFDRMRFTHCALPELDIAAIDLTTSFCGRRLSAPMMIGAMTGGTVRTEHQEYYKKNPMRYMFYRNRCGRDQRIKELAK